MRPIVERSRLVYHGFAWEWFPQKSTKVRKMPKFDRRAFLHRLGLGTLALGPLGGLAHSLGLSDNSEEQLRAEIEGALDGPGPSSLHARTAGALLTPLQPGARLATSTLSAIEPQEHHLRLNLLSHDGSSFRLEVFGRDDSPDAFRPVTRTARFDIFVANGGRGSKRTERAHGLAAYALADVISRNEALVVSAAFKTLRARALG